MPQRMHSSTPSHGIADRFTRAIVCFGRQGKERSERFLKSAAANMVNGGHPWLRDGVEQ